MSSGTFNVSRRIWSHPVFAPSEYSEREAFLWLVSEASWKARTVRSGRVVVDVDRGQLCASIRFMAEAWGWSRSRVDRFIKRLQKHDMIRTESGTGQLVVTLCNYDEYQGQRDTSGTRAGHDRDTSGTNYKKDEIREEGIREDTNVSSSRARKRASRLPADWVLPSDWGLWALDQGFDEGIIRREADKFKDYWIAASGQKATKLDWFATWRNWLRNVPKQEKNHGKRNSDGSAAAMAQRIGERWASRGMDSGQDTDAPVSLFSARRADGGAGGGSW